MSLEMITQLLLWDTSCIRLLRQWPTLSYLRAGSLSGTRQPMPAFVLGLNFDIGTKHTNGTSLFVCTLALSLHFAHFFTEPATGHTQWELPFEDHQQAQPGPPTTNPKRRQYAAGQSQAYSGAAELPPIQPQAYADPSAAVGPGPALFTPGLEQTQMQQPYYGQDTGAGYGAPGQTPAYGQPQQQQMSQMTDQFAHMGMGGQKGVSCQSYSFINAC